MNYELLLLFCCILTVLLDLSLHQRGLNQIELLASGERIPNDR